MCCWTLDGVSSPLCWGVGMGFGGQRAVRGGFVMTGFTHTHISRKQPLPFRSLWRVPPGSQSVLSALSYWLCGWCRRGLPHWTIALDEHAENKHTHTHLSPKILGTETCPAVDLTFTLRHSLDDMPAPPELPSEFSEPCSNIYVFVVCRIDHSSVWKGKLNLTPLCTYAVALMFGAGLHPSLAANSLK